MYNNLIFFFTIIKYLAFSINDIMEQLEELSADMDIVNEIFRNVGSNYKNIIKLIEQAHQYNRQRKFCT